MSYILCALDPTMQTSMGVIDYGNEFFKELFEVTDEILASGSFSGEDLLKSEEYPYYVKVGQWFFLVEFTMCSRV